MSKLAMFLMKRRILLAPLFAVVFCHALMGRAGAAQYTVRDLGDFYPTAMNKGGQVAGFAWATGSTTPDAVVYSQGLLTTLGAGAANAINDNGLAAGYLVVTVPDVPGSGIRTHAFIYSTGEDVLYEIGNQAPVYNTVFHAINSSGTAVGEYWDGNPHALLYPGPGLVAGHGFLLTSINDTGQTVARAVASGHALFFPDGVSGSIVDLGEHNSNFPVRINNSGQVIYTVAGHGFLYDAGTVTSLAAMGVAGGINNFGQVVGGKLENAFIYRDGQVTNLNTLISPTSGWVLEMANDINDVGQIVGRGRNPAGQERAFLLTPVPEPSTSVLLALGGFARLFHRFGRDRRRS